MAREEIIIDDLWAGWNNEQYYGDDKNPYIKDTFPIKYTSTANYPVPVTTAPIRNAIANQGALEKLLAQFGLNNQTPTTQTGAGFDLQAFFAENKLLVLGGLAVVGYLMFASRSGGLAEKTVVTRYNTRK